MGFPARPAVAVALGKFDGVHCGHRHLVAHVLAASALQAETAGSSPDVAGGKPGTSDSARARSNVRLEVADHDTLSAGTAPTVLIVYPDPAVVLAGREVQLLTTLSERRARLASLGVQRAEVLEFNESLASLEPAEFVERLVAHYALAAFVAGEGFVFGRDRSGGIDDLRRLGAEHGFRVVEVPPLSVGGDRVSSRRIRALIEAGNVEDARTLLRKPPIVTGVVVRGAARGRELGFPTANLALERRYVVPANGIYTVRARWQRDGTTRLADGIASVGVRPTFDNGAKQVEVYLLDFGGDLYGEELTVEFLSRQRAEERFDSIEALVAQMERDVDVAESILALEARRTGSVVTSTNGSTLAAIGYDLADALELGSAVLVAAGKGSDLNLSVSAATLPASRHMRFEQVTVTEPGLENAVQSWLQTSASADWCHVYQAETRDDHTVITGVVAKRADTNGASTPLRLETVRADAVEIKQTGWVEIRATLEWTTGAEADADHRRG